MIRTARSLLFASLLLLAACPRTDVDVGTLGPDVGTPSVDAEAVASEGAANPSNIGAICNVGVDTFVDSQAIFNAAAPECSSGVCVKPAVNPLAGAAASGISPLCTAACSSDADCAGLLGGGGDGHCVSGFTCGIPFVKGPMCCKKLCLCKDITGGPVEVPIACEGDQALVCNL